MVKSAENVLNYDWFGIARAINLKFGMVFHFRDVNSCLGSKKTLLELQFKPYIAVNKPGI